ncbi:hypothetical protein KR215_003747 [Drosophila sulfurigaster]|nr:hypothetical protein KR215_003747 [Drosophila sulfurigaster]
MSESQKSSASNDSNEVLIEEIDSNDVPENELAQFQETEPLRVFEIIEYDNENNGNEQSSATHDEEEEGALIRRYVQGVQCLEFPDFCTKLEPGDEDEDEEETLTQTNDNDDQSECEASTSGAAAAKKSLLTKAKPETAVSQRSGGGGGGGGGGHWGRRSQLSPALLGLMGEANLSFVYGRYDTAERICMEIIRQNPLASEPFYTLAEIYENRDEVKFLHFSTIAAHLNPQDRDMWIRISDLLVQQGHLARARVCYTKAIKVIQKDYLLRFRKAQLLERMGETNAAMFTYLKMLPLMPSTEWNLCLTTGKNVARYFHVLEKHTIALEAMDGAYSVCSSRFTLEDLNIYLELLILNKQYETVLRCLRERTTLEIETEQDEKESLELIYFCHIPDDYVPELRAKLCVSLIHMHAHHLLGYLVQNVQEHISPTVDRVELYMDITEALMQEHKYAEAIALMRPITDGDSFECPAFVWLRQAECLRQINRTNEAIQSYARVVQLAPYCYEAKFTLSALLKQQGRPEEAVKALEQSGEQEGQPLHARLLYERCVMLQQIGRIEEFLDIGYVLLGRNSIKLKNREEMLAAANGGSTYNTEGLKAILQMRSLAAGATGNAEQEPQVSEKIGAGAISDLTIKNEYDLFLELIRTAFAHGKFSAIERICFAMVTTKRFTFYHYEIERIIILACLFNRDCAIGFSYLRELIAKQPENVNLWNILSLMVQQGDEVRYFRYTRRLLQRHPSVTQAMRLFLGHYHLNCSSYKYALNVYVPILRENPHPLVALSIAVVFNQLSLQKKVLRKSAAISQSIAFAQRYAELRTRKQKGTEKDSSISSCAAQQEIYYNIGRIYHQANILHLAVEYYERALAQQHPLIKKHEEILGLQHEVAFNLHLIYRANGNKWKARQCLMRYCVV